jgi:phosphatidyl-myo-inositol alpha-mannosyltransferase
MRIAQICPYSLTLPGGVQGQVMGLARVLRDLGHEVRVLGPCDGPPPEPWVTPLGLSIPTASNGSVAPIAPDPSAALRTIRALRDEGFDVVHLHEPLVPGPTLTALIVAEVPRVGTFHRAGASSAYQRLKPAVRWAARRLDVRCAVSEEAAATAGAALGGDYEILFNGIETDRFSKADPWPSEGPTICFLGRHEPRKGLAVLLEAMTLLPADVRLWVASEGPQTAELQARTAGDRRVSWLGRISDEEKASRLRGATVFCAPSLGGESFGVVLLEAMAAQTPVVASDLRGYRAVARPGIDALLVPPGDARVLAETLVRVLGDQDLAGELVTSGEQRAASFAMARLADRYLDRPDRGPAVGRRRSQAPALSLGPGGPPYRPERRWGRGREPGWPASSRHRRGRARRGRRR